MKAAAAIVVPFLVVATITAVRLSAGGAIASQTVAQRTKDGADKTKGAVVKGAHVAGEKTKDGLSKSGEVMTDTWVTARIHQRFVGEDLLKDSEISVDTSRHVVTLTGTVTRWAGRTLAEKIARRTEGVHQVVNRLTVGSKRND